MKCRKLQWSLIAFTSVILAGGCGGSRVPQQEGAANRLAIADFADDSRIDQIPLNPVEADEALIVSGFRLPEKADFFTGYEIRSETFFDVRVAPGESVVVDSLVGQVNGRPLYADEVLGPVADQLNAEYLRLVEESTPPQWEQFQRILIKLVASQLQDLVLNELYLSEARASLSAQEKTGLMAFMENLREELVGERGGVFGEAEQQIMREEGLNWEEYLKMQEDQLLIRTLMQEKIQPNIVMSWKDVERLYNAEKNSSSRIPRSRSVELACGRRATKRRSAPSRRCSRPAIRSRWSPPGQVRPMMVSGMSSRWARAASPTSRWPISTSRISRGSSPEIRPLPSKRGSYTIWVSVIKIDQPEHRDLYDPAVQNMLQGEIMNRKMTSARQDFIEVS